MECFASSFAIAQSLRPDNPVIVNRPHSVARAANWFVRNFAGEVLYAVKANPSEWVLDALYANGIKMFDVASLVECELIHRKFPDAVLAFMHPVKNRNAITRAYNEFGVRIFSLDCIEELEKIQEATNYAKDLTLMVRLSVSNSSSSISLDSKFGIKGTEAVELLRAARATTREDLGICFHVGSQCMDPMAYVKAMDYAKSIIIQAGVVIDIIDVGGGFPVNYRTMNPPPMSQYMAAIAQKFETLPVTENCSLWCEPGRALVAEASSVLARVELRTGNTIYLNDGAYGNLFDAAHVNWPFETRALCIEDAPSNETISFKVFGPTCDSIDVLNSEYFLPENIKEGDYIEFKMLGAYGIAMATRFNGFGQSDEYIVKDEPHISMYSSKNSQLQSNWQSQKGQ